MKHRMLIVAALLCVGCLASEDEFLHRKHISPEPYLNVMESSRTFWNNKAANYINNKVAEKWNKNKAKNVILFLGDGMSLATVAATRMYMGSEQTELAFEKFPHFGLSKTYCVDAQVADSACSATAYLNGVKANSGTIGVNAKVMYGDCVVDKATHTESIASWAQKACKSAGLVTTTRVTHASPAGVYGHTSRRGNENDAAIYARCKGTGMPEPVDLATQLIYNEEALKLKVILGGGRREFINSTVNDEEGIPGRRSDGKNLINEWKQERSKTGNASYIWNKHQLNDIDYENTDYLLGLFENDHCAYHLDNVNNNKQKEKPSLTDMTVAAIKMLSKDDNGYFLFVEGGKIDLAHHDNKPRKSLEETKEFSRAIDMARQMTDESDTLIVVTSDHSHSFTYNGYPDRGSDILGVAEVSLEDNKPYATLSYANGPGYSVTFDSKATDNSRLDITDYDFKNPNLRHPVLVPLSSDTHAGEDVGIYASGPWSHIFEGSYEQNNIPLLMAYAAKIGPFNENEDETCLKKDDKNDKDNGSNVIVSSLIVLSVGVLTSLFV